MSKFHRRNTHDVLCWCGWILGI